MRIWFDTEFWDTGSSIALLSIGMYREDGQTYYAEPAGAPWPQIKASAEIDERERWLVDNVLPHLTGEIKPRYQIADEIVAFCGDAPEFWAYVAAYDWVALNQLYGPLVDRPKGWPIFCWDVKQLLLDAGDPWVPKTVGTEHNALDDAMWAHVAWSVANDVRTSCRAWRTAARYTPVSAGDDAALERAISDAGRDRVFALASLNGYCRDAPPPKHVWWALIQMAKMERPG